MTDNDALKAALTELTDDEGPFDQKGLARRVGIDQSTISRWKKADIINTPNREAVDKIMALFKQHFPDSVYAQEPNQPGMQHVRLTGVIGAGDTVYSIEVADLDHDTVEAPVAFGPLEAVKVRGDSMWPKYEHGDTIFFSKRARPESVVGKHCLVRLMDDRVMVKKVLKGSIDGHYNLASYNAPTIENVILVEAFPVRYVEQNND